VAGPRGFEPQSPAPQASVLILTRLRAPFARLSTPETINTLLNLKSNGLRDSTLKVVSSILKHIEAHADLNNPEDVKRFISEKKCSESYKVNLVKSYNYYAQCNGLEWTKPKYNLTNRSFKVPTKEAVYKIIAASSPKYSIVFKLLAETGAGPEELHQVRSRDIDLDKGTIAIAGCKGHNARTIPLKSDMVALLKMMRAHCHKREE